MLHQDTRRVRRAATLMAATAAVAAVAVIGPSAAAGATTAVAAKCRPTLAAGDQTITVDGATVPVYVPAKTGSKRVPLVLDLHGSSSNGKAEMDGDGIRALADAKHFVVAAPDGAVPFTTTPEFSGFAWNIPGVPLVGTTAYPPAGTRDDVQFLDHVIDGVAKATCIDRARVYATGVSGGARMASQLACDLSDRVAAIAPISGVRFPLASDTPPHTADCTPKRPIPVIAIHGVWDPVNVFADTPPADAASLPATIKPPVPGSSWTYSAETAVDRWADFDGCSPKPTTKAITPNVDRITYSGCKGKSAVVLVKVKNSGHLSPGHGGSVDEKLVNPTNDEVDGTVLAWDFLSKYRRS